MPGRDRNGRRNNDGMRQEEATTERAAIAEATVEATIMAKMTYQRQLK